MFTRHKRIFKVIISILVISICLSCLMLRFLYTPQLTANIDDIELIKITEADEYYYSEFCDWFHKHIAKTDRNQCYFAIVYYSVYNESEKDCDFHLPLIKNKSDSSSDYRICSKRLSVDDINFVQIPAQSNHIGCSMPLLIQSDLSADELLQSIKTNMSIEIILSLQKNRFSSP